MVIAVSGAGKKELLDRPVHEELERVMQNRVKLFANASDGKAMIPITTDDEYDRYTAEIVIPIISAGDAIGAVMLLSKEQGASFDQTEMKVCETAAGFMGKQMEA